MLFLSLIYLAIGLTHAAGTGTSTRLKIKGQKFFVGDGNEFFFKGVSFSPQTPADPLVDANRCVGAATQMSAMGVNAIRVYHVDPTQDHDDCMAAFDDKGIYLLLDLDSSSPQSTGDINIDGKGEWTSDMFKEYKAVMDAFQKYNNLAAFLIGNEQINTPAETIVAPYLAAAITDMKRYGKATYGADQVYIGYSSTDKPFLDGNLPQYLDCVADAEVPDFFGVNTYSCGCGTTVDDTTTSCYESILEATSPFLGAVLLTETGCNQIDGQTAPGLRTFQDQTIFLGEQQFVDRMSGSIVYSWFEEGNSYGIVELTLASGAIATAPHGTIGNQYNELQSRWKTLQPSGPAYASYTGYPTSRPTCPAVVASSWSVTETVLPSTYQAA